MTGMVETGVLGAKVEEKLFQNRYLVDAGRPHIKVRSARYSVEGAALTHLYLPGGLLQSQ